MFFDDVNEIPTIAKRSGCSVFVAPDDVKVDLPRAVVLTPEGKTVITIEQVRGVLARLSVKQKTDQFIVVRPAETLGEEAANAMLKSLEEPGEKVHFVLVTDAPSRLLPTVLSRSAVYVLKNTPGVNAGVMADEKTKALAKRLMVCRPTELPGLADEICKKKDGVRSQALSVLAAAIEMSYKTYFVTGKLAFLNRIPKFLRAYEAIEKNGHVKLHLVADLL